jgi:hypothetical protein
MIAATSPIHELTEAAEGAEQFEMTVRFDLPRGKQLEASIARASLTHPQVLRTTLTEETAKRRKVLPLPATSLEDAIRQIVATYPKARLLPDSIRVDIRRGQRAAHLLRPVAVQAWHEAFGLPIPSLEELRKRPELTQRGTGSDPLRAPTRRESSRPKPTDFAGFLGRLKEAADPAKLDKAMAMLKADRFKLFARVEADHLVGVVKSQSDPDLVYSCRLADGGTYACCTQNLNICGGLRGSPCKHLLVLIVGLAQAGELDAGTAHDWVESSRGKKPELDKDAMAATFFRYKGAEAGEVDWRPTETIPEDFYAM